MKTSYINVHNSIIKFLKTGTKVMIFFEYKKHKAYNIVYFSYFLVKTGIGQRIMPGIKPGKNRSGRH